MQQEGGVLVRTRVELDGSLSELRVSRSSGYPILDAEALRFIGQCRFDAVSGNFKPALASHPVRFRLD